MASHVTILNAYKVDVPENAETREIVKDIKRTRNTYSLLKYVLKGIPTRDELDKEARKYGMVFPKSYSKDDMVKYILENILFYEDVRLGQEFNLDEILSSYDPEEYLMTYPDQSLKLHFPQIYVFSSCRQTTIRRLVDELLKFRVIVMKSSPKKIQRNKAFYVDGKYLNKKEAAKISEEQVKILCKSFLIKSKNNMYDLLNVH